MNWKKCVGSLLVCAGICLLADWAFTRFVILRTADSDTSRILRLYRDNGDEIPIFGNSKANQHYDPEAMGLKAFNYGLGAACFDVTDVLLQIELAKPGTSPVIVEMQYLDTYTMGEAAFYIPLISDARFRDLFRKFNTLSWRYYVPGIRYFGYYDWYVKEYLSRRSGLIVNFRQGFAHHTHPLLYNPDAMAGFVRERLNGRNGYFPAPEQEERLVAHIAKHPQRLFFLMYSPYHPSYFTHFQNAEKLRAFQERVKSFPNVVLIDFSHEVFPDEMFEDTVHLREPGAEIYSRKAGEKIREALRERHLPIPGEAAMK